MSKYSRRPVVVEAFQFGNEETPDWFNEQLSTGKFQIKEDAVEFHFFGSNLVVPKGTFIIKGPRGEIFPCREDIFHETHTKLNIQGHS